ncbi:MAG: hypothetical protein J7L54_05895 [Elusimicrobia bacterium]|nr:hypothetical protein [Elusimicrobiota bacterium]
MKLRKFYETYYGNEKIRDIIRNQFRDASYVVGSGPALIRKNWSFPVKIAEVSRLDEFLDEGLDIYRPALSLSDDFYIFWDLEYFNRKDRKAVYRNQRAIFDKMSPIIEEICSFFDFFGIRYIIDTTASGVHFWMKISKKSAVFGKLAAEGFLTKSITRKYALSDQSDIKRRRAVPAAVARAYDGAGKVLEFATQTIRTRNRGKFELPFTISDAPESEDNPEGFSSDITQYGHPVYMRVFRVIASLHQKSVMFYGFQSPAADIVKKRGMSFGEVLDYMWDARKAASFYDGFDATVPSSDEGWDKLVSEYKKTAVRRIHRELEETPARFVEPNELKPEVAKFFSPENCNPALLDPKILKKIVYEYEDDVGALKGVFELIARMYEDDSYGWYDPKRMTGIDWKKYDSFQAAHFWSRVYYTQFVLDGLCCGYGY